MKSTMNKSGYDKYIQQIWDMKDKAYQETKNMNWQEFQNHISKDLKEIKNKLKNKST